ncbi:MAG TPA: hypothetical protein VK589_25535 [Chryseolinea sp.]|nr:hypothetical protein [Chryseolinea sp.]
MENEKEKLEVLYKTRLLELKIEHLEDDVEVINKTLYNDGQGMVYDVRQLKYDKRSSSGRMAFAFNIISILISLVVVVLMILERSNNVG